MVYSYDLKLLQKRELSQLQICYLFSINRNMTLRKKSELLQVAIPIILIQLIYEAENFNQCITPVIAMSHKQPCVLEQLSAAAAYPF